MSKRRRKPGPDDFRSRFGFHTTPFSRELSVDRRHVLPYVEEVVESLYRTLLLRESAALIAPAGTGKTVVARALKARLPEARFHVHYVKVTDLSKRDMCREIALAADCKPAGNFPTLVRRLQERFQRGAESDGVRPVLILDDAHEMRPETLSLLKVLTNYDMDSRLVLSVVLVGQPALRKTLRREDLEDVARRLAHYAALRLLSREETRAYLEHRSALAGAVTPPFDESAYEAAYELSRGNMRAIDRLSLTALQIASRADHDVASGTHFAEARKSLWP
ncbi:MAG: AAA family ATPase [Planctomycetes bacterium]|nr:AAA family ATPase [Planctomycetota bacterium]